MATPTVTRIVTSGVKKYVLDDIPGHGCVMGFSLYLLTNKYKGYCLEVQRQSDSATLNVGFNYALRNPYVDISAIEAFCTGTTGKVKTWYNEFGGNNATQNAFNNMPIICTNGVFESNGIKFVASSFTNLIVLNYAALNITAQPISYYANYNNITSHTGYIFSKNDTTSDRSVSLVGIAGNMTAYINNSTVINSVAIQNATGINKVLFKWNIGINNSKINSNGNEATATYNTTPITNTATNVCIGARFNTYPLVSTHLNAYLNTVLLFNTDRYNDYTKISGGC
jgi:hypothetical protein